MLRYLRAIDWKNLFMWLFAWYILPQILGFVLASWLFALYGEGNEIREGVALTAVFGLLWWWLIAPVGCGFMVTRTVTQLPQLHVLLAVGLGFVFQAVRITPAVGWLFPAWGLFSLAGGAFGAYLSHVIAKRKQNEV